MNKNRISFVKKLTAGMLAIGMVVAVFAVAPKKADAAVAEDKVIYVEYKADEISKNYWTEENKTAPVKAGYVFGGWFERVEKETTKTESDGTYIYNPLTTVSGDAFAKFVPAQVLSIKAQNGVNEGYELPEKAEDINPNNPIYVRLMTSLDSLNYQDIGFNIYLNHTTRPKDNQDNDYILETSKVFSSVYVGEDAELTDVTDIFGGVSEYACVWELQDINHPSNATKIIYVRPYWHTMDGTKVLGLAKYVHIEDQYNGYISVPINLLDGQDVAAGEVHMTYADTNAETPLAWQVKEVEIGRVLKEMSYIVSGNTIKMVGSGENVGEYLKDASGERETIFANVRFKRVDNTEDTEDVTFTTIMKKFCDWEPRAVTINSWDVKHDATEIVSQ